MGDIKSSINFFIVVIKNLKLKVLHVLNSLGFGGTEIWLLEIVKLNQNRLQFDFLLTSGEESTLDQEFKKYGCNLIYLKYSKDSIFSFIFGINKLVKNNGYSVIHNHEDFISGWHWLFLLPNRKQKRISHAHNSLIYVENYSNSLRRKLSYRIGKVLVGVFASFITGTSNDLLNQLGYDKRLYSRKRIEPLYCGVNSELFRFDINQRSQIRNKFKFEEDEKIVVFVGRIDCPRQTDVNHKNPIFALDIAKRITQTNKKIKFLFVGEKGEVGNKEEENIREQGLDNQIVFLGKRTDVNLIMNGADIFLLTSILEPFGLVLIEAQLCGLKIISSNIITKELIECDEQFKLLDLNEPEVWVNTLNAELWNTQMREDFIDHNSEKLRRSKFSIEVSYQRLINYYSM